MKSNSMKNYYDTFVNVKDLMRKKPYNKYNAKKVEKDGFKFDSVKEWKRYEQLKILCQAGEIHDLRIHPKYQLIPAFVEVKNGKKTKIRETYYTADFSYLDRKTKRHVVEDVKGMKTPVYNLKLKMFLYMHGHSYNFYEI